MSKNKRRTGVEGVLLTEYRLARSARKPRLRAPGRQITNSSSVIAIGNSTRAH